MRKYPPVSSPATIPMAKPRSPRDGIRRTATARPMKPWSSPAMQFSLNDLRAMLIWFAKTTNVVEIAPATTIANSKWFMASSFLKRK